MTLSDSDLQDQLTKLTKKQAYSNDVSSDLYRQLSRRIECHHESGNVCVFPKRGHGVHDIFDSSRERGKKRTQLLKAQAAEDIFASSYVSRQTV